MSYKYVTGNNLFDKQNYMYSEYNGRAFLQEYMDLRLNYLDLMNELQPYVNENQYIHGETYYALKKLLDEIKIGDFNNEIKRQIDMFVKAFEVRKRLYNQYDLNWKPIENTGFEDYDNYMMLANISSFIYEKTKCLKYYSCMLKVDDTLLSVARADKFTLEQIENMKILLMKEIEIFQKLSMEQGISVEEE